MKIPQIQIQLTNINMDYSISDAKQTIKQPNATQTIEQPAATLEIHTTDGELKIDASQARRDVHMFGPIEATKNAAQAGKQKAMEGISRRVNEGNQLMRNAGKEQKGDIIHQIAKQNHGPKRAGPYNIDFVPSIGSVKIDYTPAKVDVTIQAQQPKINHQVNKPTIDYTPGKVSGKMIQRQSVDIRV